MSRMPALYLMATMLALPAPAAWSGDAARGEQIFRSTCATCHVQPKRLKTPTGQVREKLASPAIPAHRLVRLSEAECEDLLHYLAVER